MATPVPLLPDGSILFHAGFHKTGTTALQSAFAGTRPQLLESGVLYPGSLRSHHRAAMAVSGRTWGWEQYGGRPPRKKYWNSLAAETRAHPGRVMISSEAFALADEAALDRIVAELGADRLQAVLTLRPIARLLASSYQQYLKYGLKMPYGTWLENVFANPPECPPSPNFWRRNDFVGVLSRWAERIGPDRVTLVVLDEGDRGALFRTFEGLLGLPEGLLVPDAEIGASNRSMTAAEAEMLRLVNAGRGRGWEWPEYQNGVRRGAVMRMVESRTPSRDEPMLMTPEWAVQAAQDVGRRTARSVAELGVTVVGDPARLADPIPAGDPQVEGIMLPVEAAAEAVLGGILGVLGSALTQDDLDRAVDAAQRRAAELAAKEAVEELGTRDAAGLLRQRLREAGQWRVARARRRIRRG